MVRRTLSDYAGHGGRDLFGDGEEFWNPDLPYKADYKQLVSAGERQVRSLIECAHQHGMEAAVFAPTTDFPPEFAPFIEGRGEVAANWRCVRAQILPWTIQRSFGLSTAVSKQP